MVVECVTAAIVPSTQPKQWKNGTGMHSRSFSVRFIAEQFEPKRVLQMVQDEKCTGLHGVPTMFIAELNHPDFALFDTSTLRTGIMAGSPCPIEVMKKVINEMGASEITIAYGQTESSPVITQTRRDDEIGKRVSTVGKPHTGVEVKIIDPATGERVDTGVPGELCTISSQFLSVKLFTFF